MGLFLPTTYFPDHADNLMANEGMLAQARERFLHNRPSNLEFLLSSRFSWMNDYLENKKEIFELGSGCGFAKLYIKNPNLKLTDVSGESWIDQHVDALNLPFPPESVDVFICSHMIHHLANPKIFFERASKCLKPGGYILISEINTSWFMKLLLRLMRHEGWSLTTDVFDPNATANDPRDPWSANCAIPELLFRKSQTFENQFPQFKVVRNELTEFLIFPLSGGVIAKTKTINFPHWLLVGIQGVDHLMIKLFPRIFALGRRVVLKKTSI